MINELKNIKENHEKEILARDGKILSLEELLSKKRDVEE